MLNPAKWLLLISIMITCYPALAEIPVLEVIQVNNRPAAELIPLLEPLLDDQGRIVADGANLIVSTTPENLPEIKALIRKLDIRPVDLVITVVQSTSSTAEQLNAALRAGIRSSKQGNSALAISHYYQTEDQSGQDNTHTLRVLAGNPAYIRSDTLTPSTRTEVYGNAYGQPLASSGTSYQETSSGFAVTPQLSGKDDVILDVEPWSGQINTHKQILTQSSRTTLRAKLGEWIELGVIDENNQRAAGGNFARVLQTDAKRTHMLVKVDKAGR